MRNIFELTKREQRIVIMIVTTLVAFAFAKHFWQDKSQPSPGRATLTPAASPTVHSEESVDDSRD